MGNRGERREGRRVCRSGGHPHTQDVTHAVCGERFALLPGLREGLGL